MRLRAWILGVLLACGTVAAAAAEWALKAEAYPPWGQEPGSLRARCRVADPAAARGLSIALADQAGALRSSFVDAGRVTRLNEILIERVPCGRYVVACALLARDGSKTTQHADYQVFGSCDGE